MRERLKKRTIVIGCAVASALPAVSAFAESGGTANSAVTTAVSDIADDMMATGAAIIPVALGVIGLTIVVRYGIKVFRSVIGR